MTYAQQVQAGADAVTRSRIRQAVLSAALDIVGESQGASSNLVHEKRHKLGVMLLGGNDHKVDIIVDAVLTQVGDVEPPYADTIIDSTIDTSVAAVWNDIAGVMDGE